ncbi:MAG TPA: helix-turn-helix domain-containing protein [Solirubrobacterales bacterium]|nr:helix-turn-helix domain-containing protein [Solirubrobacterales bacterium]
MGPVARSHRDHPSNLGPYLRNVRKGAKLSLRDIEKRSGLSNGYLSQLERNEVDHPSPTVLRKLATGYDLDFPILLYWAGFVEDEQLALTPNQAAALSTIGDPTDEELEALRGILEVLRSRRTATSYAAALPSVELDTTTQTEITGFARALLLEAGGLGCRPTPLEELSAAANLVQAGEIELSPTDRAKLTARFGRLLEKGWARLLGALDFRTNEVWIKPDLHPKKQRFTLSHEIGHAILPAHRETFAVIDDLESLSPRARALFEREANFAAAQLLFQCGELSEEADSSPITMKRICEYADSFDASIVATAREVAERSRHDVAVGIAHQPRQAMGPTQLFTSPSFEKRFRWNSGLAPHSMLREKLVTADGKARRVEMSCEDAAGNRAIIRVESIHTGWAAIVLIARDPGIRRAVRRIADEIPF